jgi:hypothetical protein
MQYEILLAKLRSWLNIRPLWVAFETRLLLILKLFYIYLAFVGIFAFALFIAQEATQVVIWSNFNGLSEKRYNLVKENLEYLEDINKTGRFINKYFMWINPVQRWGYNAFHRGTEHYVKTIAASVLANEPSLYMGQYMTFEFRHSQYSQIEGGQYLATFGKVSVILSDMPANTNKYYTVSGLVRPDPKKPGHIVVIDQSRNQDTQRKL